MTRSIDNKSVFEFLRITKEGMGRIINIFKMSKIDCYRKGPYSLSEYLSRSDFDEIYGIMRTFTIPKSLSHGAVIRQTYLAAMIMVPLGDHANLKEILGEIIKQKGHFYYSKKNEPPTPLAFLNYLTKDDNYLDIAPVVKILSEYMDLPLKGKSLEEYREAIVSECKKMIKEMEKSKNETE